MQSTHSLHRLAAAVLALAGAGAALAQSNPYYIGGSIGYSHDSNIARVSDADAPLLVGSGRLASKSDNILVTSLLAGIDQTISRQRLNANIALRDNRFSDNKSYDNTGYEAAVRLDWQTIERLSGALYLRSEQSRFIDSRSVLVAVPGSPGQFVSLPITDRILSRGTEGGFTARIGVVTRWTAEASLVHQRQDYKSDTFAIDTRDSRLTTLTPRLVYQPSNLLQLGVGLRLGRGSLGSTADNGYKRNDLDLTAQWKPSGASTIDARLGIGRQNYEAASIGDFSGASGSLRWGWQPSGKLQLAAQLSRDTGQYAGADASLRALGGGITSGEVQTTSVGTTAALSAVWAATGKITVTGSLVHTQRTLEELFNASTPPTVTPQPGSSRTTGINLAARWAALRTVTLGCDIGWSQRSVSSEGIGINGARLTHPYSGSSLGCNVQALLQP